MTNTPIMGFRVIISVGKSPKNSLKECVFVNCQKYTPTDDCFFGDFSHWEYTLSIEIK